MFPSDCLVHTLRRSQAVCGCEAYSSFLICKVDEWNNIGDFCYSWFLLLLTGDRILCSPGWPWTHLGSLGWPWTSDLLASTFNVLELVTGVTTEFVRSWRSTPGLHACWQALYMFNLCTACSWVGTFLVTYLIKYKHVINCASIWWYLKYGPSHILRSPSPPLWA